MAKEKQMVFNLNGQMIDLSKMKNVYIGKDDWCRCGCGGNYYDKGTKGFNMVIGRFRTAFEKNYIRMNEVENKLGVRGYVNIPYDEKYKNRCFCFYYDDAPVYDVYGNVEK